MLQAGTVSHLYLTSDGGMNLNTLYNMTKLLGDHVELVNHNTLADMALSASGVRGGARN